MHLKSSRGRGPGTWGRIRRDNVGKVLLPAGADSNLQRPTDRGDAQRQREGLGLADESVVAKKKG